MMDKALPLEIYELIMSNLSRDDVEALRLTCKEIEYRISHILFKTVVVPFNPEIYGMLHRPRRLSGSKKSSTPSARGLSKFFWQGKCDPNLYIGHGVDVFRGFGPHIKKYGMSFEVDEGE